MDKFFYSATTPEYLSMDVESLANKYSVSKDESEKSSIISAIYIKYEPKRNKTVSVYKQLHLDYDEVDSVYLGIVYNCLQSYDPSRNVKFSTLLNVAWDNKVKNMKRPEDYTLIKTCDSLNRTIDNGDGESVELGCLIENKNSEDKRILDLQELYSMFDEKELRVVKCIVEMVDEQRYSKSMDTQIKKLTGLSKESILAIRTSIAQKLVANGCYQGV